LKASGNHQECPYLVWKIDETECLKLMHPCEDYLVNKGLGKERRMDGILNVCEHAHCVFADIPGDVGANDPQQCTEKKVAGTYV
jgi:hypothetical protein